MDDSISDKPLVDPKVVLDEALACIGQNQILRAETLLAQLLVDTPDNASALQLMGLIRRAQDRIVEAEELYRRSLAIDPDQPQVHHNLANLLKSQNRFEEAVAEYRDAIRLKPNYVEAHLNLAIALSLMGNHVAAEKSCRDALRIQPNYLFAKQTHAAELCELGRPAEAERLLRQTLALGVRDSRQVAALEHNLAMSLKMQRRHEEALRLFDSAQAKVPDMPTVDYNRGNTLQHLGRLEEAAEFYRRALSRNPIDMNAHRDLNQLLYRLGDDENLLRSYDEVAELYPDVGSLPLDKASFLMLLGRADDAREALQRAVRLLPNDAAPHNGLGLMLADKGEFEAAIREHEIAVKVDPGNAPLWRQYAQTLLRAGDPKSARLAAERSLALEPQNQSAIAVWGLTLRALGDPLEECVNDVDNLVRVYDVSPPAGYADMDSFNRDLNVYLDRLHLDKRECIDQTLRTGTQTLDNIFGADHAPVELLRASVDHAVADYIAQMKHDETHPLFARRRAQFEYSASWSSRLRDCGFHTNHIHPKGWISSAYYVALPDAVEKPGAQEGWIKFGEPHFDCALKDPVRRVVQPRVGALVLFPSYMWHGTVPFHSQQSRTTIAFDVVPRL